MKSALRGALFATILVFATLYSDSASAQPYGNWLNFPASSNASYVRVAHSPTMTFGTGYTFEAWVNVTASSGCSTIAGKDYLNGWWIGICGTTLRSYLRGGGSLMDGGTVPVNDWTHIAVTYDGVTHKHYVDGELVMSRAEAGDMSNNTAEMRIGSDVAWQFTPAGGIDEVRLWNVARSQADIRANINKPLSGATGVVALYHFDGTPTDATGSNPGSTQGAATFVGLPSGTTCTSNATTLCTESGRYQITADYVTSSGTRGQGKVASGLGATTANSGIFWFFDATNYELLVKTLNGCSVNNRKWVYAAATTDVHYELTVFDTQGGAQKKYFNYLGAPAPAVTDAGAFATCP
jgi:hypothetical protein